MKEGEYRGFGFIYRPKYRNKKTGEEKTSAIWWVSYPSNGKQLRESTHTADSKKAGKFLKDRIGKVATNQPTGRVVERTTLKDLLDMVEADYKANGRRSLERMIDATVHLRELLNPARKARDITVDMLTSYKAERLETAKPSTVNYELAILRRGFRLGRHKVPQRPDFEMLH